MFKAIISENKKAFVFYLLICYLAMSLVFLAFTVYTQANTDARQRERAEVAALELVMVEKEIMEAKVEVLLADLLFINDSLDLGLENEEEMEELEQLWISFSNRKKVYDQVRFLDSSGMEIMRVNYKEACAVSVTGDDLQDKSDRYYFVDSIGLAQGEVFFSKLDLNVENGEIEQPIKPMLRVATPYYTADGVLMGITVLNYDAEDTLKQVSEIASAGRGYMFVLNHDGYWVYNNQDDSKTWTFMYEDQKHISFAAEFPREWATMQTEEGGYAYTENGVFYYTTLTPNTLVSDVITEQDLVNAAGRFYIVSYFPPDSAIGALFLQNVFHIAGKVLPTSYYIYLIILAVSLLFAAVLTVNRSQRQKIKFFSEYDALTGVYNRRACYQRLNTLKKSIAGRNVEISLCFLDINGLKEVNDQLGHDAGDSLIKSVAETIKDSVRGNDFVARLGGDEFLIVFDRLDRKGAESVWNRIVGRFEQINAQEGRRYMISVSHGVSVFRSDEDLSIDDIISRADEKMYEEKRRIKKGLNVIRDRNEGKSN